MLGASVRDYLKNCVNPVSDKIIRKYIKELQDEFQKKWDIHPWMRSDPFESEVYQCDFNGTRIPLTQFFWKNDAQRKENIIIISGEKHIGKSFFVEKILSNCIVSVSEEKKNLIKKNNQGLYRIPILVKQSWFHQQGEKISTLDVLITEVLAEHHCQNRNEKNWLKEDVEKLLSQGRFVVYFQDNEWICTEEKLANILEFGKVYSNYCANAKYRNIVLFTSDMKGKIKDSFLNERNSGYICLKPLQTEEVKEYLEKRKLTKLLEIAQNHEDIMELMQYPEHLRMFEVLDSQEMINSLAAIKDKFDLYEFFIRAHIKKVLENANAYEIHRENTIFEDLQDYSWNSYIEDRNNLTIGKSRYFTSDNGEKCGLLKKEISDLDKSKYNFVFPYCAYFLIAKRLLEKITNEKDGLLSNWIPSTVKPEILERILILVSQMIKETEEEVFAKYWKLLIYDSRYTLLLLAKVVKNSNFQNIYERMLYEKAFENLKSEFYDYSVLETFQELSVGCARYLRSEYFTLDNYTEKERNNIKKRIVYYLGISHNGILEGMIDELLAENTDRHLKYHIIRAAVENCGVSEDTTQLILRRISDIGKYCLQDSDPIIKSDFTLLYEKCFPNKSWQTEAEKMHMQNQLETKLTDDIYWVRAHAAGAIGRIKNEEASELLINCIKQELQNIYNLRNRNSIKVISYSVEALCELDEKLSRDSKEKVIKQLLELLVVSKMPNKDIEDAYSTIATGIEFMINQSKDKPAFNLGGRFRNKTLDYKKILLYIFQELCNFYDDNQQMQALVQKKIQVLKGEKTTRINDTKRNCRILHLSDWHLIEDSTSNNLILDSIKDFAPIDILIITGDLKQIHRDYIKTLKTLEIIVKSLNLTPDNVFMVPGNHDSEDIENQADIYQRIRNDIYKQGDCYRKDLDKLHTAFDAYNSFVKEFYGTEHSMNGDAHNHIINWKGCLQILRINTCLVCDRESSAKKIVDTLELSGLEGNGNLPLIAISHHPFAELHDVQRSAIKTKFEKLKVSALLSGDKHISSNATIGNIENGIPNLIIGKTYPESEDHYSEHNIAIYVLDFEKMKMIPYLKKFEKSKFVPCIEFSIEEENGIWCPMEINLKLAK